VTGDPGEPASGRGTGGFAPAGLGCRDRSRSPDHLSRRCFAAGGPSDFPARLAAQILTSLGYRASNYRGSWHEWSRDDALPSETG